MKRAALAGLLACTSCSGWQSALDPQGLQAHALSRLIWLILIVAALVWTLVMIALFAGLRQRSGTTPSERKLTVIVSSAVGATVIVIAALTLVSFFTTRSLTAATDDVLTIEVRGHQ